MLSLYRLLISTALLAIILVSQPAYAATGTTYFNIPQPLWDQINAVVVALILALASLVWKWLAEHSPLKKTQTEEIARTAFMQLATMAAKYGLTQAQSLERKVGDIDVGNAAVAAAANFLITQGPGIAAKVGFDVTTPEGRAAVVRSVTARVGDLMTPEGNAPTAITLPPQVSPAAPSTKS